ncbi:hypothetical protein [Lentilactobacillus hilgardii]
MLCCNADSFQEDEAAHVVDDIDQSDPRGGPGDTDCSDEYSRL